MVSTRLGISSLFAIFALTASAAHAADMPIPVLQPVEEFGGWYLRGDIGMSNQRVGNLDNALYATNPYTPVNRDFSSAPFFGLGVGYAFNSWLRIDITGEYRGGADFHGLDIYPTGDDEYSGVKSELTFLANAYVDLGTWYSITPFVGAGIGLSRNTISDFTDVNTIAPQVAYGGTASKWSLAWALHAGLAYQVAPNFTVELAYRYLNLGSAQSGDLVTYNGTNLIYNPMEFNHLTSHDVKFGMRWAIEPVQMLRPVYAPPPLSSRG